MSKNTCHNVCAVAECSGGLQPIYYNRKTGACYNYAVRSRACKWWHNAAILIALLWRASAFLQIIFLFSSYTITDKIVSLLMLNMYWFSGFLHINSKFNSLDTIQVLNSIGTLKKAFKGKYRYHEESHLVTLGSLACYWSLAILVLLFTAGATYNNCRLHIAIRDPEVCIGNQQGIFKFLIYGAQFCVVADMAFSTTAYLFILFDVVVSCKEMIKTMRQCTESIQPKEARSTVRNTARQFWYIPYRSAEVFLSHINEGSFAQLVVFVINFQISACVTALAAITVCKLEDPLLSLISGVYLVVILLTIVIGLLWVILGVADSYQFLKEQSQFHRMMGGKQVSYSCRPLRLKIGNFHETNLKVLGIVIEAVFNYTATILLLNEAALY